MKRSSAGSREEYPEPTPAMLDNDPLFDAIWGAIKRWDISRHNDGMYSGPTGNDVRHIYDAIRAVPQTSAETDRLDWQTASEKDCCDALCQIGGALRRVGKTRLALEAESIANSLYPGDIKPAPIVPRTAT